MKRNVKRFLRVLLALFIVANIMAMLHAYNFTHFSKEPVVRTDPRHLSFMDKAKVLLFGVSLSKPITKVQPDRPFKELDIPSNVMLDVWTMQTSFPKKGIVILFHGYGGEKSDMLDRAYVLLDMGYDVMLADFMGAGASDGYQCTLGFKEAENVKSCVEYLSNKGEQNIYLLGASMGAVAIIHACARHNLAVKGIIVECPFGNLRQSVKNRFRLMHMPYFPLGDMLMFWGGVENGFNAFAHNPDSYAKKLKVPVLLMYGEQDDRVNRSEIDDIFKNISSHKTLKTFPLAGHESYLNKYPNEWKAYVEKFLEDNGEL